jgi:hypothetical protein
MNENQNPSFLERLRALSPGAKNRIMGTVLVISVVTFGSLWAMQVKTQLTGINKNEIIPEGSVLSANNYVTLESSEEKGGKRYVHFKVVNNSNDILNFSKLENVWFETEGERKQAIALTDRQDKQFASKILSNTTVYGTAVFEGLKSTDGTLVFDTMFFEKTSGLTFKEKMDLDLKTLPPVQELRS